jgi:hypothetical protein
MARKSPWQEFAENFQGVYGTFKQIGQDVETGRIMDDEKFTAEGKAGAGLSGSALDKARYKALGDIYTKYGNAKEGLAVRTQLADLDAKERENTLNASILDELKYLRGKGAVRNLDSGSALNEANAGLSMGRLATENEMRPGKVRGQDLQNAGLRIGNNQALLTYNTDLAVAPSLRARLKSENQSVVNQADGKDEAENARNQSVVNQAAGKDEAENAVNKKLAGEATAANALRVAESQFLTDVSNPEWWKSQGVENPTPAQREAALVGMYENNPSIPIERKMAVQTALQKHGIETLQNTALETAEKAKAAVSKGGVDGLVKWYDGVDDGDKTKLDTRVVDGVHELFRIEGTGENRTETVLHSGASEAEIEAKLMGQITDPGSGMEIAASILEMRSKAATMANTEARTDYTRESLKGMVGDRQLTGAQIQLANVRAREIRAKLRATYTAAGKAETKVKEDQAALDEYLTKLGPTLALASDMDVDVDALVQQFIELRQTPITFEEE